MKPRPQTPTYRRERRWINTPYPALRAQGPSRGERGRKVEGNLDAKLEIIRPHFWRGLGKIRLKKDLGDRPLEAMEVVGGDPSSQDWETKGSSQNFERGER